jgi:hypothetical protein
LIAEKVAFSLLQLLPPLIPRNTGNVTGNVRTIDRLEPEYLHWIFNDLPGGGVADEDLLRS